MWKRLRGQSPKSPRSPQSSQVPDPLGEIEVLDDKEKVETPELGHNANGESKGPDHADEDRQVKEATELGQVEQKPYEEKDADNVGRDHSMEGSQNADDALNSEKVQILSEEVGLATKQDENEGQTSILSGKRNSRLEISTDTEKQEEIMPQRISDAIDQSEEAPSSSRQKNIPRSTPSKTKGKAPSSKNIQQPPSSGKQTITPGRTEPMSPKVDNLLDEHEQAMCDEMDSGRQADKISKTSLKKTIKDQPRVVEKQQKKLAGNSEQTNSYLHHFEAGYAIPKGVSTLQKASQQNMPGQTRNESAEFDDAISMQEEIQREDINYFQDSDFENLDDPWSPEQFSPLPRMPRLSQSEQMAQARLGDVKKRCEQTVAQFSADVHNLSVELAKCKQELLREREHKKDLERVRTQYERDINSLSKELRTMTMEMRSHAQRQQQMEDRESILRTLLTELGLKKVADIRVLFRSQQEQVVSLETSLRDMTQDLEWTKQSHRYIQEQCRAMEKELSDARKIRWEADSKRMKVEEDLEREAQAHRRAKLLSSQLRAQVAHLSAQLKMNNSPRIEAPLSPQLTVHSPQINFITPTYDSTKLHNSSGAMGSPKSVMMPRVPQLQNVIGLSSNELHRPASGRKTHQTSNQSAARGRGLAGRRTKLKLT